jgi:Domain of unknown function (DUF4261)
MVDDAARTELRRPSPVLVELLFEGEPAIDGTALAAGVAARADTATELVPGPPLGIAFPEWPVQFADGSAPLVVWLMEPGEMTRPDGWIEQTMRQTWAWDAAPEVVARCRSSILVADLMAGPLHQRARLPLYHAVLATLVESSRPQALHWIKGERFMEPEAYLRDVAADPLAFESTVNVRYVTLSDRPGEQLMDTVGMAPFGLPDIQALFTTLDPPWVAGKLLSVAAYVFEHGDVIEDGHTIPGFREDESWRCAHELALMGPEREVLDIDVGAHGPARR